MNERIKDLLPNPFAVDYQHKDGPLDLYTEKEMIRFAELIVRECIDKMLNSDDEHFMKLEGWELGGSNHNSWTRGVLDSVAVVREHFGVEE